MSCRDFHDHHDSIHSSFRMSLSALFPTLEHPGLQIGSGTHKALFSLMACVLMLPNAWNTPSFAVLMAGTSYLSDLCLLAASLQRSLSGQPTQPCLVFSITEWSLLLYWYCSLNSLIFCAFVYSFLVYLSHHQNVNPFFIIISYIPAPNKQMNEVKLSELMNQPTWWNVFAIYRPYPAAEYVKNGIIHLSLSKRPEIKMLKARFMVFWPPQSEDLKNNSIWSLDPFSFLSPLPSPTFLITQAYFGYLRILMDVLFSFLWTFCYENSSSD